MARAAAVDVYGVSVRLRPLGEGDERRFTDQDLWDVYSPDINPAGSGRIGGLLKRRDGTWFAYSPVDMWGKVSVDGFGEECGESDTRLHALNRLIALWQWAKDHVEPEPPADNDAFAAALLAACESSLDELAEYEDSALRIDPDGCHCPWPWTARSCAYCRAHPEPEPPADGEPRDGRMASLLWRDLHAVYGDGRTLAGYIADHDRRHPDPEPPHPPSVVIPPAAFAPVSGGGHEEPAGFVRNEYGVLVNANLCPNCEGSGFYDGWTLDEHGDPDEYESGSCPVCGGAGSLNPAALGHSDADLVARQAARDVAEWPAMFSRVDDVGLCCPTCLVDLLDTDDEAEPASDTGTVCARCGKDAYRAGYDAARAHLADGLTDYGRHVQLASWRERLADTGTDYDRGIVDGYAGADPCPRCHGTGYEHDGPRCIGCDGARVVTA